MDAATITRAGLDVMAEGGFDGLSMRAVADRLGVHVGGLYHHLPNKAALKRSMADSVCRSVLSRTTTGSSWQEDASALCRGVRSAVLGIRDGARLLAESPLLGSDGAVALMERLVITLERGLAPPVAASAADALLSYVTGFALQEQLAPAARPGAATPAPGPASSGGGVPTAVEHPRVATALTATEDELFEAALRAIITGFSAESP